MLVKILAVVGGLLPVATMVSKGIVDASTIQRGYVEVKEANQDVLYKLTNDFVFPGISQVVGGFLTGFASFSFCLAISSTGSSFKNVTIKKISGNTNNIKFYYDDNGVYYKRVGTGAFTLTLVSAGYNSIFDPLFTPNPAGNDTSNMTEIVIS